VNSEGNPAVPGAPLVGADCEVFGGHREIEIGGTRLGMTMHFYVFRVSTVVVKLFAAQGVAAGRDLLTPDRVAAIAARIVCRMEDLASR